MCGLKAAQMNERPFKATKELGTLLKHNNAFFAFGNADCDFLAFIIHELVAWVYKRTVLILYKTTQNTV